MRKQISRLRKAVLLLLDAIDIGSCSDCPVDAPKAKVAKAYAQRALRSTKERTGV